MKESKESILSSFIKYLKSFIHNVKEEDREETIPTIPREKPNRKESKLDLHRGEIIKALDNGASKASIARKYGVSAVNLHYWIQRRKIKISKKR
jgi:transcriptional regulator with GAF, ATPase, and Fis domain